MAVGGFGVGGRCSPNSRLNSDEAMTWEMGCNKAGDPCLLERLLMLEANTVIFNVKVSVEIPREWLVIKDMD